MTKETYDMHTNNTKKQTNTIAKTEREVKNIENHIHSQISRQKGLKHGKTYALLNINTKSQKQTCLIYILTKGPKSST